MMNKRPPYTKNWPRKNLGEMVNFLEKIYPDGFSLAEVAEKTDMRTQDVSRMFVHDDMKLSKAEKIATDYGFRLHLFFPEWEGVGLDYSIRHKDYPNAGNLSGLAKYIYDRKISINYMSQRIGRANNVLTNAFAKGDIFISTLYDIIKNLNIEVVWSFEKIDESINS